MKKGSTKHIGPSPFELKWGIDLDTLAKQDGVTNEAIYMRINHFGTPFQRKKKPTTLEAKYHKTAVELCHELGVHPVTLGLREREFGTVYVPVKRKTKVKPEQMLEKIPINKLFWLHPMHPDYPQQRKQWGI